MDTFSDDLSSASIFQKRLVVQCGVLLLCIVTCIAVAFLAFPKKKMRKTKHASYSKQKSQSWWSKLVWGRRKIETKEDRERRAKASFRVKRSDLRPKTRSRANRSGFHNAKRTQQQRRVPQETVSTRLWKFVASFSWTDTQVMEKELVPEACLEGTHGLDEVVVVGMDCEMVGAGRGGYESLLARCSIVMYSGDENQVKTLYDKIVKPTKRVVDYRTQWSGITKEMFQGESPLPVVSFAVCRNEVSQLFASIDGKPVVVVGHALKNDFDALGLQHPSSFTRDTSTYRPFMRQGRFRMMQRKLSHLCEEELDLSIQNSASGHSSVEDATGAFQLYWKRRNEWEQSLGYPFASLKADSIDDIKRKRVGQKWAPLTLYLDGCNLPLGMRTTRDNSGKVSLQLISKTFAQGTQEICSKTDWVPILKSSLITSSPTISKIVVMFDGANFKHMNENKRPISREVSNNMHLEITDIGTEVDDVIVERCIQDHHQVRRASSGPIIDIDEAISLLENMSDLGFGAMDETQNDSLESFIIVRRNGGGSKTHRKLFDKLNLRRPEEGALCLTGLTVRLQKNSLRIARELKHARVHGIVEYELRQRRIVRSVCITDDVLLADRLVKNGGIVLNYQQLQQFF